MNRVLEGIKVGKQRLQQRALPIAGASLLLGLCFDWLFFEKVPGISVFLFTALILGILFGLAWYFKYQVNKSVYWLAPVTVFFSLMVFVRANEFLAFVNICLVLYLLLMTAQLMRGSTKLLQQYRLGQYFDLLFTPLQIIGEFWQFVLRALTYRPTGKHSVTPIIRGLILSIPVLAIFLALLSSADTVFREHIGSLFDLNLSADAVGHLIMIGVVTSLFIGAYALIFMPSKQPKAKELSERKTFSLGATEASTILGSVGFLFLTFVLVQFTSFFGGSDHVMSTGETYADYARKGFFQLIAVAAISLGLLLGIKKAAAFRTLSQTTIFKWLSGGLIAEVMIIILSAHLRLGLYEEAYGFTTLRLWSHIFIFWLIAAFALLAVHIYREQSDQRFAFNMFMSVLGFFAVINLINPDAFIAKQNINRLDETGKIDMHYLGNLSADATPAVYKLRNHPNKDIRKQASTAIYRHQDRNMNYGQHWQSANLARERASLLFGNPADRF